MHEERVFILWCFMMKRIIARQHAIPTTGIRRIGGTGRRMNTLHCADGFLLFNGLDRFNNSGTYINLPIDHEMATGMKVPDKKQKRRG